MFRAPTEGYFRVSGEIAWEWRLSQYAQQVSFDAGRLSLAELLHVLVERGVVLRNLGSFARKLCGVLDLSGIYLYQSRFFGLLGSAFGLFELLLGFGRSTLIAGRSTSHARKRRWFGRLEILPARLRHGLSDASELERLYLQRSSISF
ncbi:hypothetical protein BCD49_23280 [Pseudofrankia sp. EUN1h]|nr:hypothetical protein BCD49_23280 [Pseudofrankia sp. EUN1h]